MKHQLSPNNAKVQLYIQLREMLKILKNNRCNNLRKKKKLNFSQIIRIYSNKAPPQSKERKKRIQISKKNSVNMSMKLCDGNFCEIKMENRYPFCDEICEQQMKDDKQSRVLYITRKPKQLSAHSTKPQSVIHEAIKQKYQSNQMKGFNKQICTYGRPDQQNEFSPEKISHQSYQFLEYGILKNHKLNVLDRQRSIRKNIQKLSIDSHQRSKSKIGQMKHQSQISLFQKQKELQKKNSLSIVNFSTIYQTYQDFSSWNQESNESNSNLLKTQEKIDKIQKLRQIYLEKEFQTIQNPNTQRTTSSYQYDQFYRSSPKNFSELCHHHSLVFAQQKEKQQMMEKSKTSLNLFLKK